MAGECVQLVRREAQSPKNAGAIKLAWPSVTVNFPVHRVPETSRVWMQP